MKTILALVDHSDVTPKVLDETHRLARAFGGRVILLHVTPETVIAEYGPVPLSAEERRAEQQKLFALRDALAARGTSATAQQAEGNVVDTILVKCRQLAPDLIIMGSHGHGSLYNLLVGSVTAGVLKRATCPVMVVPGNAEAREEPAADTTEEQELEDTGFAHD